MTTQSISHTHTSCKPIKHFAAHLPHKPYCSDYLPAGLQIRPKATAMRCRYIQPDGPTHQRWMIYDLDHAKDPAVWIDADLLPPHIVVGRYDNDRSYHYLYLIDPPLRTARDGSPHARAYWTAAYRAVGEQLGADPRYTGLICKSPLHPSWWVTEIATAPYSLEEMSRGLDLDPPKEREYLSIGEGRNCDLFDGLRGWAYRAIRRYREGSYATWSDACQEQAEALADHYEPTYTLPYREVMSVASSVCRWVWVRYGGKWDAYDYEVYLYYQRAYGTRGGKATAAKHDMSALGAKGGKVTAAKHDMSALGAKGGQAVKEGSDRQLRPWEALGISRATYYRQKP